MKHILGLRLLVMGGILGWTIGVYAQQTINVPPVIKTQEKQKILVLKPAAEAQFPDQEKVIQELYDLFLYDLRFADVFIVLEENSQANYLDRQDREKNTVDYAEWRRLQVQQFNLDYLVKVNLVPRGPGLMELDLLAYDLVQGQRLVGTAYGKNPPFAVKDIRHAGHRATAEIIRTLTNNTVTPITESRIAFVNAVTTKTIPAKSVKEIFIMDYDGWEKSIMQVTFYSTITLFPAWSPDGNDLAYVSFKNNWPDSFIHNLPTGKVSVLAQFEGTNTTPRWYPDGNSLAISLSAHGNPEIYKIPKSGKDPKRLTFNRGIDEAPDVSPTGNQIVFISNRLNDSPQVYIMDSDGANARRISLVERKCDTPVWSPVPINGEYRIAFCGYVGVNAADIYTVRPDGTDTQLITDGSGGNLNPTWSPDGKYIAFSSNRLGKNEIFITSSDYTRLLPNGKRYHRLTNLPGENLSPAWSWK